MYYKINILETHKFIQCSGIHDLDFVNSLDMLTLDYLFVCYLYNVHCSQIKINKTRFQEINTQYNM